MWRELVFEVPRDDVERWSDALLEAGALSVLAEDADADSPDEQALYGEPGTVADSAWRRTRLTALAAAEADPGMLLRVAAGAIARAVPAEVALREVDDRDWVRETQAQFEPIEIGERLRIAPSWHAPPEGDARISIVLDPGLAFGTGSHPTTRLCLQWLERELRAGRSVIDYGCGSGILAIAAARLGARPVVAIDIDAQALAATTANARANGAELVVRAGTDAPPAPADVVVANILSMPLVLLAPLLSSLVVPGGALVLSGVLERQVDELVAAYRDASHGAIELAVDATQDGWACLAGCKRG